MRYKLPNCKEELQNLKEGRKTLSQVFTDQEELIKEIAESYKMEIHNVQHSCEKVVVHWIAYIHVNLSFCYNLKRLYYLLALRKLIVTLPRSQVTRIRNLKYTVPVGVARFPIIEGIQGDARTESFHDSRKALEETVDYSVHERHAPVCVNRNLAS
jgi:hypothetical protein